MNNIEILEQKRKNIRLKLIGILALCAIVDFIVTLGLWIFDLTAAIVGGLLAGLSLYFYLKFRYFSGFEESLKELIRDEVLKNLGLKALTKSLQVDDINSHFNNMVKNIGEFGLFKFDEFEVRDICVRDKSEILFYGILIRGKGIKLEIKKDLLNLPTSYFNDDEIISIYITTQSDTVVANLKTPLKQSFEIVKDNIQSIIKEIKQLKAT
ncbi:hypothetical protein [Campylobacter sp.]|uniref:hypothetical protein n=1 Tax=Campylobacter sp. TaxID=205 RepID=UPI00259C891B|nr:hypothetical protein [Campylobacter sp.]MBQ7134841.1 hypothetical protein [Campylobacter sp.]